MQHVRRGEVLFEGTRDGATLKGIARIFTLACGVRPYEVAGIITEDERRIELIGLAPVLNQQCKQAGTKRDLLIFEYIGRGQ
jgi:hypothetical protein